MTIKLLAVGDLHIGRLPSRLPESLTGRALDFSPARAWEQTVELACSEGVHAVVLAGDVVESDRDFFEALPRLQAGIEKLTEAGIRILAVTGNHDVQVLPKLAARIPSFELLGEGGEWQSVTLQADKAESLTLWGWSFPAAQVRNSPLANFPGRLGSKPAIGVLHCDRDQSDSPYAPVTSGELRAANLDGWLLGHIHQPDDLGPHNPAGYLGSVVGLDAGEAGQRGPWLLEWDGGVLKRFSQMPLGPIRWQRLTVDLAGVNEPTQVASRFADAMDQLSVALDERGDRSQLIAIRLTLTGETTLSNDVLLDAMPEPEQTQHLSGHTERAWFIERYRIEAKPYRPLEEIARRDDQPGLLAKRLLTLEQNHGDPARERLIDEAMQVAEHTLSDGGWRDLPGERPTREQVAGWLQARGQDALRAMLAGEQD